MTDVPTPTRPNPGLPEKSPTNGHRRGFVASARAFFNHVPQVQWKWWLSGITVILFGFVLTQLQFNDVNARERSKLAVETRLADYSQARITYLSCLESVTWAHGGRAYDAWLLKKLEATFPNSAQANSIVSEGRQQLDILQPPRSIDECHDPGPPPGFQEDS